MQTMNSATVTTYPSLLNPLLSFYLSFRERDSLLSLLALLACWGTLKPLFIISTVDQTVFTIEQSINLFQEVFL